jgi:uncharacterized membrane protein YtjA (UPF0391 family)
MGLTLILALIALFAGFTGFGGLTLAEVLDLFQK